VKINLDDIKSWEKSYRLKFINSISGYKGVHLIGTESSSGQTNLAIFNSIVHISSNPPLVGFIMRPLTVERNTYDNIKETGFYTINHVHKSFLKQAHYTSTKFPKETSEFDLCNLAEERIVSFLAPFVKESKVKFGLKLIEDITIKANGTHLIIGEIQHAIVDEKLIDISGQLDLELANDVSVTGLNQYSSVTKFKNIPYARLEELPDFKRKERPDNVVFDKDSQSYNSNLLPYGTNIGAPSIAPTGVSTWKNISVNSFNHTFNNKIEIIKKEYKDLIEEYNVNDMLYKAKMNFEPLIGATYHLYLSDKNNEQFLSLIPPNSWKKTHIGSFKLNHQKLWAKVTDLTPAEV
jgi:flavin reductase (DIM6/NTAB) family NADH-FMN oxidoreductase RutF